ncbi:insulinase family protein [Gemmatimonas sp.]|uniref:M16 family metallopeptidase n=1 Tax=Gemmatimonas sp. TaxID=1962908 RepID=UPI00286A6855|nr:insulinase family protein [Gemmatimonas sp.]
MSFFSNLSVAVLAAVITASATVADAQRPAIKPAPKSPVDSFALPSALPTDAAVRIGTLPNGIRYYIRRNAKPEQRAELRLVVNAGSILEDEDQRGLAHFIEHMAFNGTKSFAKNDIVKYLESIGVRFGADLNAFTSFDETVYILPVPTDSAGILEKSFRFLGDVATGILFDSTEVVAERGVVLSEWRNGLGAGERLRDKQFPVIFRGSRYAERLPIGKPEILEKANPAPLKRFWRDWYRPDLMAVVAVGDADPKQLESLIRSTFGGIAPRKGARPRLIAAVPTHDSTLISIATDKELSGSSVGVLWKSKGRTTRTVGDLRRDLLERLYDQMLNQRFGELALKPETPFVGAGAGGGSFVRSSEYYSLDARAKEGQLLESLQALLTEAERVRRHGFLATELERAKTNTLRGYERAYQERDKTPSAAFVDEYVENFLQGEAIPGISFEYAAMQRLLPTVTLAEVNALGAGRVGEANRVVTVSLPEKDGLKVPTDADIRAVFGKVNAVTITPWVETVMAGALVAKAPAAGRVVSEKKTESLNLTEWTLSNGIKVFVKPTDFTADQIVMTGWSPGGASLVSDKDVFKTSLTTTVIERGGAGEYSLVDLNKKLTGKVASASAVISDLSEGVSGRASPKDLETMMQLTWLRLTSPRADTSAFKALLQQFDQVLKNKDANPAAVFSDTVQMTLAGGHPRVRPLSAEMLKELTLNEMLAIYRDRFVDLGDFTFLFVGNVDLAVLKPLVEQWLAPLPAAGRKETFKDVGPKLFTGQIDKTVRKGIAPQSQTAILMAGAAPWSREDSYLLSSVGEVLEMRLLERLRESLGGTYSVSVSAQYSRHPRQEWQLVIGYGSAPDKAESMFAAVRQELDSLRRVPPSAAEVERVREQQRRELEVARKQNGYWLSTIRARLENGDDLGTIGNEDPMIAGLTAEKLAAAAKKYLTEANRARFVLLPESK